MKNKKACTNGHDFPKKRILEIVDIFGFYVDLDRWDKDIDDGFLRIKSKKYEEINIIIHKQHLEFNVHQEELHIKEQLQNALIEVGAIQLKKEFLNLLALPEKHENIH